jgi:hypothetical protein
MTNKKITQLIKKRKKVYEEEPLTREAEQCIVQHLLVPSIDYSLPISQQQQKLAGKILDV